MEDFEKIRIPVAAALLIAAVCATLEGLLSDFTVGNILSSFFMYSLGFVGLILIAISVFPNIKFFENLGRIRPNRSSSNELGSGDMANKENAAQWLKPHDEDDTELVVKDLVGAEKLPSKNNKLYIPGGERNRHILIIAKTGSGKTTKAILPILYSDCLSKKRSSVIVDSKPEMWEKLAGMTAEHNPEKHIMLFNPLDMARSLSWNIVSKVEDDTDAKLIANTMIMATDNPAAKSDSPFFRNNALQLLNAMMVGLLNDSEEVLSIPRVHELLHSGKTELCDWLEVHPAAIRNAKTFVELSRGGSQNADTILSELGMRLAAWDLKAIRATTFEEELDLQKLIDEPTLFIVEFRESEMEMLRPIANVIVIEVLRFLTKAAEKYKGHQLPRPVGLVIDEFASSLGRLPDIHVKLNTLRSRNVSIVAAIQSIAQIKANYDKDADSVIAGFSTKILMPMLDFQDSEWASKETGTMTVRFKTKTTGSNKRMPDAFAHRSTGSNEQVQQRAVLTPDEIGRPVDNAATFFMPNTPVFQGHLVPFYEIPKMLKALSSGKDFEIRDKPIEYEEFFEDPEVLKARQAARKAAEGTGGGGQVIGAIDPVKKAVPIHKTKEELESELEEIKSRIGWSETTGVAKEWWEAFEEQNKTELKSVVALAEEIEKKSATITEFFLAYLYSNSDDILENLAYLDKMKSGEVDPAAAETQAESLPEPVSASGEENKIHSSDDSGLLVARADDFSVGDDLLESHPENFLEENYQEESQEDNLNALQENEEVNHGFDADKVLSEIESGIPSGESQRENNSSKVDSDEVDDNELNNQASSNVTESLEETVNNNLLNSSNDTLTNTPAKVIDSINNSNNSISAPISKDIPKQDDEMSSILKKVKEKQNAELRKQLEQLKDQLGWDKTTGVAREWWLDLEAENKDKLYLVLALAGDLNKRGATIKDFFMAYLESESLSIDENLIYLEEQILPKKQESDESVAA